jgi:hypothetical protein
LNDKQDLDGLTNNLNATKEAFKSIAKRAVSNILISGNRDEAESLAKTMQEKMKIDAKYISQYRVSLTENAKYADKYKIVGGLALHGLVKDRMDNINLVIKQ